MENVSTDNPLVSVIGLQLNGQVDTLINNIGLTQQSVDLSSINASQYPYIQLQMQNTDTSNYTPYQLAYWRLTYDPAPEGGLNPGQYFTIKDTVEVGEPLQFKMAFKNVTDIPFSDSMKVKVVVVDRNNVSHGFPPGP